MQLQGEDVSMSTALSARRPKEGAERPPATAPSHESWRDPLQDSFAEAEPGENSGKNQESLEKPAILWDDFPIQTRMDPILD